MPILGVRCGWTSLPRRWFRHGIGSNIFLLTPARFDRPGTLPEVSQKGTSASSAGNCIVYQPCSTTSIGFLLFRDRVFLRVSAKAIHLKECVRVTFTRCRQRSDNIECYLPSWSDRQWKGYHRPTQEFSGYFLGLASLVHFYP